MPQVGSRSDRVTYRIRLPLVACAVFSFTSLAIGQETRTAESGTSGPLTLPSAIHMAEARYPAIRAAEEQREAARNTIGVAKAAYLPRADLLWQGNRSTTNKPNIVPMAQGVVPIPSTPVRETT